jgi:hypothetical protein
MKTTEQLAEELAKELVFDIMFQAGVEQLETIKFDKCVKLVATHVLKREQKLREDAVAWHLAALKLGMYRADTDVSTPEKWISAQLAAYEKLQIPPFTAAKELLK